MAEENEDAFDQMAEETLKCYEDFLDKHEEDCEEALPAIISTFLSAALTDMAEVQGKEETLNFVNHILDESLN